MCLENFKQEKTKIVLVLYLKLSLKSNRIIIQ